MSDVAAAPASEANNETSISISRRSSVDPAQYATLVIRCHGCQTHVPVSLAHVMTTYSSNKRLRVVCSKRECGAVVCHSTTAGIQASSSLPVNWRLNRVSPSDEHTETVRAGAKQTMGNIWLILCAGQVFSYFAEHCFQQ
jgi:hypothetical protein